MNKDNLDGVSMFESGKCWDEAYNYLINDIKLFVSDIDAIKLVIVFQPRATQSLKKMFVNLDTILLFCAIGATVNDKTIERLKFDIIAGLLTMF